MFYKISILFFLLVFSSYLNATQIINPPRGYSLEARLKETNILLGETTQLTLIYRYTDVEDYEIKEPQFSGIVIKELDSKDFKDKNGSFREEINYSLTPQREGNFTLNDLQVISQIIDTKYKNFNNRSKYTKEFSLKANTLTLEVIKLPNNITAIGEYQLKASVDKQYAKEAEVVTLTLSLYGDGNIQNLDALEPKIENATLNLLYTTRSKRMHLLTKVYEIVSEQTYTIPSFELFYFDKEDMLIKKSNSEFIEVTINGYRKTQENFMDNKDKYLYFLLGFTSILVLLSLYKLLTSKKEKKESTLVKRVKKSRTKSELYKNVVVFLGRDKELDNFIYQLEDETFLNFKAIKKELIKRLVKLGLNERDNLLFTAKNTL
ncbi:MAG: hypothetical protein Q9M34_08190 [Sulfurimonas sp.]|nr:hypothetical protein [Sulfurimonas sp.]